MLFIRVCFSLNSTEINAPVMRFITELMIVSQSNNYNFKTFVDQLNETPLSATVKESTKKFIFNADIISQSTVNWLENYDSDPPVCIAEILYRQLANLFERISDNAQMKQLSIRNREKCFEYNCRSLETLLKCSDKARNIATEERFILSIVDRMEKIYSSIGGSLTDFQRKHGPVKVSNNECI